MRSTPEVSSMEVLCSVHEDSVWSMLPPRTFSVGFEEQIVVGVMFFTFTDPKIVVKSLFRSWSRENMGFVVFFKKYKIGNNDFGDLDKAMINVLSLRLPDDPGR